MSASTRENRLGRLAWVLAALCTLGALVQLVLWLLQRKSPISLFDWVQATWDAMWPSRTSGCPSPASCVFAAMSGGAGFLRPAGSTGTLCARHTVSLTLCEDEGINVPYAKAMTALCHLLS